MHLYCNNVNDAFQHLVENIHNGAIRTDVMPSRVGEVLVIPEPVIISYRYPLQRVLFSRARDANPFFHLYESLWMLAGRNDVAPLAYYNSQIAEIASDDGQTFNGAYGWRWRHADWPMMKIEDYPFPLGPYMVEEGGVDQLAVIIDQLKRKPESRRVVLQMWNVEDDLLKIDVTKDVCCNTHAYFLVENGDCSVCEGRNSSMFFVDPGPCPECGTAYGGVGHDVPRYLNMTVCNRSNDLVWGALGANAVHFAFLQEYLAACIGLEVGTYHQITNNLHVYTARWEPEKWLAEYDKTMWSPPPVEVYGGEYQTLPLVLDPERFDREVGEFVERHSRDSMAADFREPYLMHVAQPMCIAFHHHKRRDYNAALSVAESIYADDWRVAATNWLTKRRDDHHKRETAHRETNGGKADN